MTRVPCGCVVAQVLPFFGGYFCDKVSFGVVRDMPLAASVGATPFVVWSLVAF